MNKNITMYKKNVYFSDLLFKDTMCVSGFYFPFLFCYIIPYHQNAGTLPDGTITKILYCAILHGNELVGIKTISKHW